MSRVTVVHADEMARLGSQSTLIQTRVVVQLLQLEAMDTFQETGACCTLLAGCLMDGIPGLLAPDVWGCNRGDDCRRWAQTSKDDL